MSYGLYDVETGAPCIAGEDIPRGAVITVKTVGSKQVVMKALTADTPMGIAVWDTKEGQMCDRAIRGTVNVMVQGNKAIAIGDWVKLDNNGFVVAGASGKIIGQATTGASGSLAAGKTVRISVNLNITPTIPAG